MQSWLSAIILMGLSVLMLDAAANKSGEDHAALEGLVLVQVDVYPLEKRALGDIAKHFSHGTSHHLNPFVHANNTLKQESERLPLDPASVPGRVVYSQRVLGATFLVLACTSDDIIVLTPFFHGPQRHGYAIVYISVMVSFWFASCLVMEAAKAYDRPDFPCEMLCQYASILLLVVVTYKFFRDWYSGDDDDDEEESDAPEKEEVDAGTVELLEAPCKKKKPITLMRLCEVCIATNFDNLGVYIACLLNATFTPSQLLVGDAIAASIVAMILLGLGQLQFVTRVCSYMPTWLVLAFITFYMIVEVASGGMV